MHVVFIALARFNCLIYRPPCTEVVTIDSRPIEAWISRSHKWSEIYIRARLAGTKQQQQQQQQQQQPKPKESQKKQTKSPERKKKKSWRHLERAQRENWLSFLLLLLLLLPPSNYFVKRKWNWNSFDSKQRIPKQADRTFFFLFN